jgi:RimJ/RimL family protein N-acetyltransferase
MDEAVAEAMCELAGANMSAIIPSTRTKAEDRALWFESFERGLRGGTRHILHWDGDGVLCGFLSFTVRPESDDVYLNEVQIKSGAQGHGVVLARLLGQLVTALREVTVSAVRTYANRLNGRSQKLCEKMGFSVEECTERGIRYHIARRDLMVHLERFARSARPAR